MGDQRSEGGGIIPRCRPRSALQQLHGAPKSMQLPLLKPSSDGRPDDTESDPSVLEVSSRDSLLLVAWMCAQHCLPEFRAGALALGEDTSALLTYVEENLEETKRTLLAMKALQQLSNGPTASSP